MAKGENLEKPKKKGGMVIVIGMGAKPKDMKKSFGRGSADAKLAGRAKTLRRFRSGRSDIDDILERRQINPVEFHGEFLRRHNMSFEDYLESGKTDVDVQGMIDEMAERNVGKRREESRGAGRKRAIREGLLNIDRFRGMLRARGINEETWLRHVRSIPDDELDDDTFNRLVDSLQSHPSAEGQTPEDRRAQLREMGVPPHEIERQLENDRLFDEDEAYRRRNRLIAAPKRELDDNDVDAIARLLSARYPPEVAEEMAARYVQQGFHFNPSEHEFNVSMQNRDDDEDPNVGFSATSIGAETPKTMTANPRVLNDPKSTRAGQGEGMIVRPFQMRTSFDNPMNVMDAAWALLKGNPDMTDMSGNSVPPAAMNYAQQARALEDSLEWKGGKRRGVAAPEMMADENASRFADKLSKPRFARKKVGGETMQEHHNFARERSKRDTADYMDEAEGHNQFGADVNIKRMPRPAP